MNTSVCCLRLSRSSIDRVGAAPVSVRSLHSHLAYFSTSSSHHASRAQPKKANPNNKNPKQLTKTLRINRGKKVQQDTSKKPVSGERKAQRKRIVLTNDNALEVASIKDISAENVLNLDVEGKVMGLPEGIVDVLRAVEAFKPTQNWSFFRRPATLMRKETVHLGQLIARLDTRSDDKSRGTIRRILTGERLSGKSTLLLHGLSMASLKGWFIINLPEAQDIVHAHTEYAPIPTTQPTQYAQNGYISSLLSQILKANKTFLDKTPVSTNPTLPAPLPSNPKLSHLLDLGIIDPDVSWSVYLALWDELSQPGGPPIMYAIDGLSHIMRNSEYLNADAKPIHSFDLALINQFTTYLSGSKPLPNGGLVLAATSKSNAPFSGALNNCLAIAETFHVRPEALSDFSLDPTWSPYNAIDARVMEALKDLRNPNAKGLDVLHVGGLSKEEARSIVEYYAESGMVRARIDARFVSEKWSLAGMGNIGELEKATVRMRI